MSYSVRLSTACVASMLVPWLVGTAVTSLALADETYKAVAIVQLPAGSQPLASTDIAVVDPDSHAYALTDRSNKSVDVIDTRTNKKIRLLTANCQLPLPPCPFAGVSAIGQSSGPNGVIIIEHKDDVWAADGPHCTGTTTDTCDKSGSMKVLDLKSGKTKKVIYINPSDITPKAPAKVHGRVDEICYNPVSDVVLVASNAFNAFGDRFLSFINADSGDIVGKIRLDGTDTAATDPDTHKMITAVGGGIEQCQANPRDGKFYLSIPNINGTNGAVLRISAKKPFQVEKVFQIIAAGCLQPTGTPPSPGGGPAGLTIGPDHQMLVGCNGTSTQSVIIDDRDGHVIQYVSQVSGPDEVWFDRGSNHYYLAQASSAIMGVEDAGAGKTLPSPDPNALTQTGNSKNPAADPDKNLVYLPVLAKTGTGGICSTIKDVNGSTGKDDTQGCIAIYTAPLDKDDRRQEDADQK
jgi:hypothetical protein